MIITHWSRCIVTSIKSTCMMTWFVANEREHNCIKCCNNCTESETDAVSRLRTEMLLTVHVDGGERLYGQLVRFSKAFMKFALIFNDSGLELCFWYRPSVDDIVVSSLNVTVVTSQWCRLLGI